MNHKNSNQVLGYTDDAAQCLHKDPNQVSGSFLNQNKMKLILFVMTLLAFYSCDMSKQEKEKPSREVRTITVVDVYTGDTVQIKLSNNPGVSDKAYKTKPKQR